MAGQALREEPLNDGGRRRVWLQPARRAAHAACALFGCGPRVGWPVPRMAAAAVLPPVASHDDIFPVHVLQHLLLGMAGPALLALSAPVTLALRTLPRRPRRMLLRVLHSAPAAVVSAPAAALVLDLGGLYALYLTGLYRAAEHHSLVHAAMHLHMFLAGCLLSWALIGVDPVRGRPGSGGGWLCSWPSPPAMTRSPSSCMPGTSRPARVPSPPVTSAPN